MIRQLWVQHLNVLIQLFGNGFFIACRARCSLVHHTNIFFKWLRNERDMDKTLRVCFLSRGVIIEDKYENNRKNNVFLLKFTYLEFAKKTIYVSKTS